MAFLIKSWIDRLTQFPGRRKLTPTGETNEYDVERSEGLVTAEGDPLNAATMNDLEARIAAGFDGVVPTSRKINNKALSGNITLSAADVGAVRTYTSLSQLGLTSGSETMVGIIEAMLDNSCAFLPVAQNWNTSEYPRTYGGLVIERIANNRVACKFFNDKTGAPQVWYGYYHISQTPKFSGWKLMYTGASVTVSTSTPGSYLGDSIQHQTY